MSDEIPISFTTQVAASKAYSLFEEYVHLLAAERERMGFVWCGDMEIDGRFMDSDPRCSRPGRVMWGRDRDGGLWAREADGEWRELAEEEWSDSYPFAAVPSRLTR